MKRIALIGCLFIFGLTQPVQQGGAWPPDPAILFTDAVKVVKTDVWEAEVQIIGEGRRVRLASGVEFAAPEEYTIDYVVARPIDDAIFLHAHTWYFDKGWLRLDLKTGRFTRLDRDTLDTRCGPVKFLELFRDAYWVFNTDSKIRDGYLRLDRAQGRGDWVITTDAKTQAAWLCELATGSLSAPLPKGYTWAVLVHESADTRLLGVMVSPDGKWLTFAGELPDRKTLTIFSYEIKTGKLVKNGQFDQEPYIGWVLYVDWVRWIDNSTLLMRHGCGLEQCLRELWVVDVTRPNSVEYALIDRFEPEYYDNPSRLEVHYSPAKWTIAEERDSPCGHYVFYIKTRTRKRYTYGDLCIAEYGPQVGTGYYRAVAKNGKSATLVRFNPITRQRRSLYQAEIEQVLWVSADERYAALVLDDNGRIDIEPGARGELQGVMGHPRLVILNPATGKRLYETEAQFSYLLILGEWSPSVTAVNDRELVLDSLDLWPEPFQRPQEKYTLLRIKSDRATETRISEDGAGVVPGKGQLLLWTDGMGKSTGLTLYDIATGRRTPLVNGLATYRISVEVIGKDTITLDIYPAGENEYSYSRRARYTLRLPAS